MRERIYNLLWLLIEQGGRIFSSLMITILVVNHLGAEGFGILSLSLASLTALSSIVSLGMDSILFKRFISKENSPKDLIEASCYIRLIVAVVVLIITTVVNLLFDETFIDVLNVLVIGFVFDSFLSFKDYFAANLKNRFYTYSTIFALIIQLLIMYVMVNYNANIKALSITYVVSKIIQASGLYYCFYKDSGIVIVPKYHRCLIKSLLKSSFPMMLATSIGLLYSLQDQFFINVLLDERALGVYAVGIKLVLILIVLPTIISNVFYPSLVSKYNQTCKKSYEKQLESIYLIFFLLGGMTCISVYLSADFIISLLFNQEFVYASKVMEVYSVLLVISFFQSINNKILILNNLQHVIFKRSLMALVINALLNIVLIPKYGILGAAYSTVISEVFVVFSYILRSDTRFIFIYQLRAILLVNLFKPGLIESLKS